MKTLVAINIFFQIYLFFFSFLFEKQHWLSFTVCTVYLCGRLFNINSTVCPQSGLWATAAVWNSQADNKSKVFTNTQPWGAKVWRSAAHRRTHTDTFLEINKEAPLSPDSHRRPHIIFLPHNIAQPTSLLNGVCRSAGRHTTLWSVQAFWPDGRVLIWSRTQQCNTLLWAVESDCREESCTADSSDWNWTRNTVIQLFPQSFLIWSSAASAESAEGKTLLPLIFFFFVLPTTTQQLSSQFVTSHVASLLSCVD